MSNGGAGGESVADSNKDEAMAGINSESLRRLLEYDSEDSSSSSEDNLFAEDEVKWHALRVCNKTPYGDEETSSSSSSDSSSEEEDLDGVQIVGVDDDDESKVQGQWGGRGGAIKKVLKPASVVEQGMDELPPVPDLSTLSIHVEGESFVHMGHVLAIVDKLVTIEALPNGPAYDLDTLLFLDFGKKPIGFVFDVIGQVTSPIYAVRFNSIEDIRTMGVKVGDKVYSAPTSKHTQYVFLQQLLKMKGTDASWLDDDELPPEFEDFSDDEQERQHRSKHLRNLNPHGKRRPPPPHAPSGGGGGGGGGDEDPHHKHFENTMNKRNILNTKFNRYMDSYSRRSRGGGGGHHGNHFKQGHSNNNNNRGGTATAAMATQQQQQQPPATPMMVPAFDPTVPPPPLFSVAPNVSGATYFTYRDKLRQGIGNSDPGGFASGLLATPPPPPPGVDNNNRLGLDHIRSIFWGDASGGDCGGGGGGGGGGVGEGKSNNPGPSSSNPHQ